MLLVTSVVSSGCFMDTTSTIAINAEIVNAIPTIGDML